MASSSGLSESAALRLEQELVDLCRVSKNLSKEDEKHLHQLVEAVKHYLKQKCLQVVRTNQHAAVL
eukprot:12785296-Alexandrium_andersonii.AAC.1